MAGWRIPGLAYTSEAWPHICLLPFGVRLRSHLCHLVLVFRSCRALLTCTCSRNSKEHGSQPPDVEGPDAIVTKHLRSVVQLWAKHQAAWQQLPADAPPGAAVRQPLTGAGPVLPRV